MSEMRTLRIELRPDAAQCKFLNDHCGATKFAYNCVVAYWVAIYEQWVKDGSPKKAFVPSGFDLVTWFRRMRKGLIEGGEAWMEPIIWPLMDDGVFRAASAIKRFLKGEGKFPRFKRVNDSVRWQHSMRVDGNRMGLGRQRIPAVFHKRLPKDARIIAVTVKRQAGKWFASILYETAVAQKNVGNAKNGPKSAVGIDLGLTTFAILSDGTAIENPRFLKKHLKALRRQQRRLSRCQKGSNRRRRLKRKIARLHARVCNSRLYHAQQAAFKLVRDYQTICIEDLNVAGMAQNRKLARSISDAGFSIFTRELGWMATKYRRNLVRVDRFYPSSKTCSVCGNIKEGLSLSDRAWQCDNCQSHHNRDLNAAQNILREGLTGAGKLRVNDVEGAYKLGSAMAQERPLKRQGHEAKNRTFECEVTEALLAE